MNALYFNLEVRLLTRMLIVFNFMAGEKMEMGAMPPGDTTLGTYDVVTAADARSAEDICLLWFPFSLFLLLLLAAVSGLLYRTRVRASLALSLCRSLLFLLSLSLSQGGVNGQKSLFFLEAFSLVQVLPFPFQK